MVSGFLKSLLLLFQISHVVVLSNPNVRFDLSCINMFRIVDSLRIKLQSFVTEMLSQIPKISSSIVKSGRICTPNLLFLFESNGETEYLNQSNVELFSKKLQDRIYQNLRRSHLLNSINPLFTLSNSRPFVYISLTSNPLDDFEGYYFQKIHDRCNGKEIFTSIREQDYTEQTFLNFILPFIGQNLTSKHDSKNQFIEMRLSLWVKILKVFKELVFDQKYPGISSDKAKTLKKTIDSLSSTLDIDNRFSEAVCSNSFASSLNFYKENLPSHYSKEMHEHKLTLTLQNFSFNARGPSMYKYIQRLQTECENYWKNGRKSCEQPSLTGNLCTHKTHRLPQTELVDLNEVGDNQDATKNLPMMFHSSKYKLVSACDCGRRQSNREDPFTVRSANYEFYSKMRFHCRICSSLTRIRFPYYDDILDKEGWNESQNLTNKTQSRDVSPTAKTRNSSQYAQSQEQNDALDEFSLDALSTCDPISLNDSPDSLADEAESNVRSGEEEDDDQNSLSTPPSSLHDFESDEDFSEAQLNQLPESKATQLVDYNALPAMIHTQCNQEVNMARFSSWSLVCIGNSRIYSHNVGIQEQQGFLNGCNYLLPWNVTVKLPKAERLWKGKPPPGIKYQKTMRGLFSK